MSSQMSLALHEGSGGQGCNMSREGVVIPEAEGVAGPKSDFQNNHVILTALQGDGHSQASHQTTPLHHELDKP